METSDTSYAFHKKLLKIRFDSNKIDECEYLEKMAEVYAEEENKKLEMESKKLEMESKMLEMESKNRQSEIDLERERNRSREFEMECKKLDLETLREQTKIPRLPSPHKGDVVHILCDDATTPIGTCFAVKDKNNHNYHVVTAFHNMRKGEIGNKYYLAKHFTRTLNGHILVTPSVLIEVELEAWDEGLDWAILTRTDHIPFDKCIEIRTTSCYPEEKLKTYHYPVSFFTQRDKLVCRVLHFCITSWYKVQYVDGPELNLEDGLSLGSSGGVMVDGDGKAVAIYVAAVSSIDVNCDIAATVASSNQNHMTMKEGRVIAFTPVLRDYFI